MEKLQGFISKSLTDAHNLVKDLVRVTVDPRFFCGLKHRQSHEKDRQSRYLRMS